MLGDQILEEKFSVEANGGRWDESWGVGCLVGLGVGEDGNYRSGFIESRKKKKLIVPHHSYI